MAPPSEICWSICSEIPNLNSLELNKSGSISVGFPARLRRMSQYTSAPIAITPVASSAPTDSPPSCHARMPSTSPPMPTTDSSAPTRSMVRGPV